MNEVVMVQDPSSSREPEKDEPDILDLKAEAVDAVEEKPVETAEIPAAEPVTGAESTTGESGSDYSTTAGTYAASPADPVAPRATATSTLVGAGILGGLVALLAAGAMQYAGYLPSAGPSTSGGDATEISSLRSEIDGLKQQLSTIPAEMPQTGDLEKRLAALEQRDSSAPAPDPEAASKISALEKQVADLQAASTAAQNADSQKLDDIAGRLAAAEKTLKDQPGEAAVSRAIAATYLKAAVDRGDPFLTELDTFAALAPDDPAVKDLRPLAANGVKSKADLAADFNDQAKAILDAVSEPAGGEGLTDRLLSSARSLISVRPVGNVEGTDAGAILARMEDKLKNGDVKGAALEWEGLPEAGRKASEGYKAELDKRARVDELTRGLSERSATATVNAG